MDVLSRKRHGPRSVMTGIGRRRRKTESSIMKSSVARSIVTMCFNVMLWGVALWATASDSESYIHVAVESMSKPEVVSRNLRSESPPSTDTSNLHSSKNLHGMTNMKVSTTDSAMQQLEQKASEPASSEPPNESNSQLETISPILCTQKLANRKSDSTDPNQHLKESAYKHITLTDPNMYISLHDETFDDMRWAYIYKKGNYYETGITEQFRSILRNTTQPGLVIDVGMNIGWFTVYSRAMGHKVAGFDPNPIMHTRLCESLKLNGWLEDNTVQSFAYGLGAEPAMLQFTTGKNPGKASFFEDRMAKRFRKKSEVPVVRLDDVADQHGWITDVNTPIYLWKLDVEGYEYHVLEGSRKLLQSRRVQNIILENSDHDPQHVVDMFIQLYRAGYEMKMLSSTEGKPCRPKLVESLNEMFAKVATSSAESLLDKPEIALFTRVTYNIWWVRRKDHTIDINKKS
ncbi:unnamed protein product [Cylindrotheca closterium]|uniref:Methyltransferase FkbM domain-containing protein n=1 Tax=Cylindrotheca closterium TaxID=2856 RepID=A0AAD2FI03_9STRA|nr:unnamed protein product [Cylindrotheca closterium]